MGLSREVAMQARCDSWLTVVVAIAASNATIAVAQRPDAPNPENSPENVQRLLQAVAADDVFDGDAAVLIPDLMELVTRGDQRESDLAIRALGGIKSRAAQAVPVLCLKLDSSGHSTRSAAVDALVAIGDQSVAPLQELLRADSPRTRAAAVQALGRMDRMGLNDLERLAGDADPRVRAAVATALSRLGRLGVARLASLLRDPELGVAVEAARGLQSNRDDPDLAIPKLIEAISRKELAWAAATALADYGIDARRAVPAIIATYPLGRTDRFFGWCDAAEKALEHIGPPDERDLELLCTYLTHEDEEAQILAAKSLALMGTKGRSAASALEAAAQATFRRSLGVQREFESARYDYRDNSGRLFVAAEYLTAAVWHVTHDADRFVAFLERALIAAESPIDLSHPSPWDEFTADDVRSIERLLRSPNLDAQLTGLGAVDDMRALAEPLRSAVVDLARSADVSVSRQAIWSLAAIGPTAADEAAPIVLLKWREGVLSLSEFASVVSHLHYRSDETQALFEAGLNDRDRSTAKACARALCATSTQHERTAALVIAAARMETLDDRDAIEALRALIPAEESLIPYLVEQMRSDDFWTRHDAISAMGRFGRAAAPATSALQVNLNNEAAEIRLTTAKSLFQILGDASHLEQELKSAFDDEARDQVNAIETVAELGPAGNSFLHHLVAALRTPGRMFVEDLIDALQAIGTAEAVAVLEETATSKDWVLRSNATVALRKLRDADRRGED